MALEAVVCQQDLFGLSEKDLYSFLEDQNWSNSFAVEENEDQNGSLDFIGDQTENSFLQGEQWSNSSSSAASLLIPHFNELQLPNSYSSTDNAISNSTSNEQNNGLNHPVTARGRRRRSRCKKNKEEIENQRMTHIAVERNRRKQMNEYLSVLRSLMPQSYVQRSDQASTIGGAINYVRELEHRLDLVEAHGGKAVPFAGAFKFPQFSTSSAAASDAENLIISESNSLADIEVSLVESHASLKIRLKKLPKLLLKVVSGLQNLGFYILHLNVSTLDGFVLYCFTVKIEDDCKLNSVADIATTVYEMLSGVIQENDVLMSQKCII